MAQKRSNDEGEEHNVVEQLDSIRVEKKKKIRSSVKTPKFSAKRPENKSSPMFVEEMRLFEEAKLKWARECCDVEKDIPLEERTKASLKRECLVRGLACCPSVSGVIERIRLFDEKGVCVAKKGHTIVAAPVRAPFRKIPTVPFRAGMQAGIFHVPHDVVIMHILPYLDFKGLFSLLFSCGHFYHDVTNYAQKLSNQLVGTLGTPKALNALFFYTTTYTQPLTVSYLSKQLQLQAHELERAIDDAHPEPKTYEKDGVISRRGRFQKSEYFADKVVKTSVAAAIRTALNKYGSMEGVTQEANKKKKKAKAVKWNGYSFDLNKE